jgi:hypothetical protein
MPAFISPMTPTSRRTSSQAASRLATGRPSGVSWDGDREVVKLPLHGPEIVLAGRLLERPLAHHVGAERRVADVAGVVDPLGQGLQAVEELRERRPPPVDPGGHRLGRDVLGALEVPDDQVLVGRRAGREGETAVAHDDGRDAMPARRGPERVPEDLRVHVGVPVHEAGRDDLAVGVDLLAGALLDAADGHDAAVTDSHVGAVPGQAGPVDDGPVLDDEVVRHRLGPSSPPILRPRRAHRQGAGGAAAGRP